MVERLEVTAHRDPLRQAFHARLPEHLLQSHAPRQHDVHGRQRRGHVGEQPQLLDEPRGQRVRLVDEDHEPRAGGGQPADAFHERDPQVGLVDAAVGFADRRHHRLPQRAAGADAGPREQGHVKVVANVLGHLGQEQ